VSGLLNWQLLPRKDGWRDTSKKGLDFGDKQAFSEFKGFKINTEKGNLEILATKA